MSQKRRRRPGAGRKRLDPKGSVVAPVRFTQDDWKNIKRLALKNGRDASKEVRAAVHYWLRLLEKPEQHIGALICLIAILVRRIEARSGRKWMEDPATGTFVREGIEQLIFHFAPTPAKPVTVPSDIASIPGELITIAENLHPQHWPVLPPPLLGGDWDVLALIVRDLGSGWYRNKDIWFGRKGEVS